MIIEDKSTVLGIDEAGRGSVIGPLVMGCVIMPRDKLRFLKRIGVNDSKKLTNNKRKIVSRNSTTNRPTKTKWNKLKSNRNQCNV